MSGNFVHILKIFVLGFGSGQERHCAMYLIYDIFVRLFTVCVCAFAIVRRLRELCSVIDDIGLTCVVQQTLTTVVYYPIFHAKSLLFPPFGYLAGPHYRLLLPAWTLTAKVDSDCQPVSFVQFSYDSFFSSRVRNSNPVTKLPTEPRFDTKNTAKHFISR